MNINKLKKIGVSALAGSLVSFAANAADFSVSGGASLTIDKTAESKGGTVTQGDSLKFNASGETDGGLSIAAYFEMDGDDAGFDDRYISFGNADMGTVKFWGHGGSSVMSQFDDISPKAYEEITDVTTSSDATAVSADTVIGGIGNDNMFEYTSPSFAGVTLKAAMNTASGDSTVNNNKYSDIGVSISPEMVEGLTVYYAAGTNEATAGTDTDVSTMAVKYAYGPITVSYQESESDVAGSTDDDEVEQFGVSYTVSDELSISYGTRERDYNTASTTGDGNLTQEDTGFGISYTMGGVAIKAQSNSSDNIAGGNTAQDDEESTSVSISFAF